MSDRRLSGGYAADQVQVDERSGEPNDVDEVAQYQTASSKASDCSRC